MDLSEERALQKCAERIRKDVDPSYSFLYDLYTQKVITHDDMETIMGLPSTNAKVAKLLIILPRRGPEAFSSFKTYLKKDYKWIAEALDKELLNLSKKRNDNRLQANLVRVVNRKLVPLVFSQAFDYAEANEPMQKTVNKIEYLAKKLESNVHAALEMSIPQKINLSIDKLIEEKLKSERSEESTETRKLREKVQQLEDKLRKETDTLKGEITSMRQAGRKQQKVMQQTTKESKLLKTKNTKLMKDMEKLMADNKNLKQAMNSMKSQNMIHEMFTPGQH
ncbi:hypothetical protein ACF0H5_022726 [Mactra antiquata]